MSHQDTDSRALPPPLMTSEPGSFARATIVERKPEIIRRVIADNAYPQPIEEALADFVSEIASGLVQPPSTHSGEDEFWRTQWAEYDGRTWLELPWYFAETYFYLRLLEVVGYFQPGPWYLRDPFASQKRAQEVQAVKQISDAWHQVSEVAPEARFVPLLHASLWGNRADLSNFTVQERAVGSSAADREHIVIDHTLEVQALLQAGVQQVAFINDTVGADSLLDLIMADFLLTQGWAKQVTFHLKNRPFFVSDAMPEDIHHVIAGLRLSRSSEIAPLADRLEHHIASGILQLATHPFWTQSLCFPDMPAEVRSQLERADLVILKGDVNYRRLLSDRHWPHTTSLDDIAGYFPRPLLALRTLKGELIVGLATGQAEQLAATDATWLINGKRGLIHLAL